MRIYLCGQRSFGRAVLAILLERGHQLAGVSAPPAHGDREDALWGLATDERLPRLPAGALNASTMPPDVDLIVCAHSHDFVGRGTRLRARHGALGYHPSLLPLHRGRDAVRWAVKMGDRVTGGSVYWLSDTVDGGPIAAQEFVFVRPGETAPELWRRALHPLGVALLARVVDDVSAGRAARVPQDEALATWEPSMGRPPLRRPDLTLLRADNQAPDEGPALAPGAAAPAVRYGELPLVGSPEWVAASARRAGSSRPTPGDCSTTAHGPR